MAYVDMGSKGSSLAIIARARAEGEAWGRGYLYIASRCPDML